jgi:hypothetical protein
MRFEKKNPPRVFSVGREAPIHISDCGRVYLEPDEQVTFVTADGKEHDFAAKDWGFYATPSVNGRLAAQGFRTALVRNPAGRRYVMVVNRDRMESFEQYLCDEKQTVEAWLDER